LELNDISHIQEDISNLNSLKKQDDRQRQIISYSIEKAKT